MSNPDLSPADLTDTAASLAADTEFAYRLIRAASASEPAVAERMSLAS